MTIDRHDAAHPTDVDLVAWIDEPETRATDVVAHVEGCVSCRARIRELEAVQAALAIDPAMPSDEAFADQRERILAAIAVRSEAAPEAGRLVSRLGWLVPLAAAAAIAVFVLVGDDDESRAPVTAGTAPLTATAPADDESPLPLVARAHEAAEEAAAALVPAGAADDAEAAVVPAEPIDEDAFDAALAAAEPLAPPVSVELSLTTESRFAELAEEDQDAVLLELADADFDM